MKGFGYMQSVLAPRHQLKAGIDREIAELKAWTRMTCWIVAEIGGMLVGVEIVRIGSVVVEIGSP